MSDSNAPPENISRASSEPSIVQGEHFSYELGPTLGKGKFGKVKGAVNTVTGQRVAVKIIKKSLVHDGNGSEVAREVRCLQVPGLHYSTIHRPVHLTCWCAMDEASYSVNLSAHLLKYTSAMCVLTKMVDTARSSLTISVSLCLNHSTSPVNLALEVTSYQFNQMR